MQHFSNYRLLATIISLNKYRSSHRRCCVGKGVLRNLAEVFSCEFCKISKNTFFYRKPLVASSKNSFFNTIYLQHSLSECLRDQVFIHFLTKKKQLNYLLIKLCVRYSFASLFCMAKRECF